MTYLGQIVQYEIADLSAPAGTLALKYVDAQLILLVLAAILET